MGKAVKWKWDDKFVETVKYLPRIEDNEMYKVRILKTNSEVIVPDFMLEKKLTVDQIPQGYEEIDPDKAADAL